MGLPCDIFFNKYAQKLSDCFSFYSYVINELFWKIGRHEKLLRIWMKNSPFGFININKELICFKPIRDTF